MPSEPAFFSGRSRRGGARRADDAPRPGGWHSYSVYVAEHLTTVYVAEGKFADAEALYKETLETARRALGADHPQTLGILSDLGVMYQRQGKFSRLRPMPRRPLPDGSTR